MARFRAAIVIAGVTVVSLVVLEVLARLVLPAYADRDRYLDMAFRLLTNSSVAVSDTTPTYSRRFGFMTSPHKTERMSVDGVEYVVHTNSLGFRTREPGPRSTGEYRLLLLGDSMMWGIGVNDDRTIAAALERQGRTAFRDGRTLTAFNYSVIAFNTVQEALVAEQFVDNLAPDVVVLGFFTANDLIPNALATIDGEGNYSVRADKLEQWRRELERSLRPYAWSVVGRVITLRVLVPRIRYQLAVRPEVLGESLNWIRRVQRAALQHGARFVVVVLQPRDAIGGGLLEAWSGSRRVGSLVSEACIRDGMEVVNLIDSFHGKKAAKSGFHRKDGHFSAAGNEAVAAAILSRVAMPEPPR